jgi:hypothetical protein
MVLAVAFGFDGTRLFSVDANGELRYWSLSFPSPPLTGEKFAENSVRRHMVHSRMRDPHC